MESWHSKAKRIHVRDFNLQNGHYDVQNKEFGEFSVNAVRMKPNKNERLIPIQEILLDIATMEELCVRAGHLGITIWMGEQGSPKNTQVKLSRVYIFMLFKVSQVYNNVHQIYFCWTQSNILSGGENLQKVKIYNYIISFCDYLRNLYQNPEMMPLILERDATVLLKGNAAMKYENTRILGHYCSPLYSYYRVLCSIYPTAPCYPCRAVYFMEVMVKNCMDRIQLSRENHHFNSNLILTSCWSNYSYQTLLVK